MLDRLPYQVSNAFLPHPPQVMGVAVSGGSDSMALLHLLKDFCDANGVELRAVTVDHHLRKEARRETEMVAAHCAGIGVSHQTLHWDAWKGKGNLQNAAREGRYGRIADWARAQKIETIAMGHTADDQAETFLMRLSRSSGVDGLSGMRRRVMRNGITWVRPLLQSRREVLQTYLRKRDIPWVNDPSNDDDRFRRIKARRALRLLSELGINEEILAEVADQLGEARKALDWQTFLAARQIVRIEGGAIVLDEPGLRLQPDEIQRRLLVRAIGWVSGSVYPPRRGALAHVVAALRRGQAGTLDGCHVRRIASTIWIFREYAAVKDIVAAPDQIWDRHWKLRHVEGGHWPALTVRALGIEGLRQCPDWRSSRLPHIVLQSTPSIWQDAELVSAPLAGHPQQWVAEIVGGGDTFYGALLAH